MPMQKIKVPQEINIATRKKKKKIDWLRFERDYVCIKDRRKGNLIRIHILRKLLKAAARN